MNTSIWVLWKLQVPFQNKSFSARTLRTTTSTSLYGRKPQARPITEAGFFVPCCKFCNKPQSDKMSNRSRAHTRPTMLQSVNYLCTMFGANPIYDYLCSDIRKDSRRGWCCVGEAIRCQSSTEIWGAGASGAQPGTAPLPKRII